MLKDSYILPPIMGGSGSLYNQFVDFPYITPPPLYGLYFKTTMGYHIGSLVHYVFTQNKSNDYLEMVLHHVVTFYLYAFSYMSNTLIGPIVALIHDFSDVFLHIARIFSETEYHKVTGVSLGIAMIAWVYARLSLLPWSIYVSTI